MKHRRAVYIAGIIFCMAVVFLGGQYLRRQELQKGIAEKIIRFHVIANSDSTEDQQLKLAVRDAIGQEMGKSLEGVTDKEACETILTEQLSRIEQTADAVIAEAGYQYKTQAYLTTTEFPVKSYGDYTFPAGDYEALELVIGAGEGHNWWCVMYPNMCFSDSVYEVVEEESKESLQQVLSKDEYEEVLSSGNYEIRFRYFTFLNHLSDGNEE